MLLELLFPAKVSEKTHFAAAVSGIHWPQSVSVFEWSFLEILVDKR